VSRIPQAVARLVVPLAALLLPGCRAGPTGSDQPGAAPDALVIGDTFTLASRALAETRRINVYAPAAYAAEPAARFPVLYMPDGGLHEDFLHVAGLVQVLAGNGGMRPFLVVGIENTQRRRDLTGPTQAESDRAIAPQVGGSAAFRAFLRDELMPEVRRRYRTTEEAALVGESLAGLFVVETLLLEPGLFDTYLAFDASLWWDGGRLSAGAADRLRALPALRATLWLASSRDDGGEAVRLAAALAEAAPPGLRWHHERMEEESHATIFHPAALRGFRAVLGTRP
jgi:predicted alpha/beta superfamily hydrolase